MSSWGPCRVVCVRPALVRVMLVYTPMSDSSVPVGRVGSASLVAVSSPWLQMLPLRKTINPQCRLLTKASLACRCRKRMLHSVRILYFIQRLIGKLHTLWPQVVCCSGSACQQAFSKWSPPQLSIPVNDVLMPYPRGAGMDRAKVSWFTRRRVL